MARSERSGRGVVPAGPPSVIDLDRDLERMRDYIAGRLSEEEKLAFEDRLARDPAFVEELEQTLCLRGGLQVLRGRGWFQKAPSRAKAVRFWLPWLAAAVIAGIAFFWVQRSAEAGAVLTASTIDANEVVPVTAHLNLETMRGRSTPELLLPAGGLIQFQAAPGIGTASHFKLTLVRLDEGHSTPVGVVKGLAVSGRYVQVYGNASRLSPGRYLLRVEPDGEGIATSQTYPFNLYKLPTR
jgi:hypothetical protein